MAAPPKHDPLVCYERLLATNPAVERKGKANPYTSLNGHMFSFLTKAGRLALRLPAAAREAFLAEHRTQLVVEYGTVMKEYVEVPDALFQDTEKLKPYFDQSFAYIGSLKPKPTTRRRKKPAGG